MTKTLLKSKLSHLEEELALQIRAAKLPKPTREFRFMPPRLFRFDFAWPEKKLAVEVEGGIWVRGGHTRGGGFTSNCEKYNWAILEGWRVLRFTDREIKNGDALQMIEECM
jgi:very-short-patch-repair endonuclease